MSLKGSEAVQVKIEPLQTDDEANMESENERQHAGDIHLKVKEEPDWNIEAYLAANPCGGQVANNDHVCSTSKDLGNRAHVIKKETDEWNKASQSSWDLDHVVKVERDIDVPDVSEVTLHVNEYTQNTALMQSKTQTVCTNVDVKKELNSNISTISMVTTPTGLYIDHVVKVERESDESANKVPCILEKYLNHLSKESEIETEHTQHINESEVQSGLCTDNMVKIESAIPLTGLYMDHDQNNLSKESKSKTEDTRDMDESGAFKAGLCTDNMVKIECTTPLVGLYMDHVVKEELVVGPEVLQKPHQAINQAGDNTPFVSCSVRVETMHVDMDCGLCRIGDNTYKLGPCLQRHQGSITQKDQNKEMTTKPESLSHQISKTKDKSHKCDICDFATAYRYKLTHHKRKHSDDKPFQCLLCSYASAFKAHLQIHERTHAKIKPYKCDKCSYTCVQKSDLQVHKRKHTGEKPYKCNYCDYACNRKRDLLTHIRTHTGEKPFKCQHCDYGCIRKRDLIAHTTTHHSGINDDGQEFKVIYKCTYCSFSTPIRQSWIIHERNIHASEKPFQCKRCSYAVSCRTSFLNHMQKHTGIVEKRFKCSHCDYGTNHKTHLSVHQRKHTGEKPYKCSHCAYASAHRRDLFVHEALHKGDKTYKCNRCTYGCNNLSNLRTHEKMHVGESENKLTETLKDPL